MRAARPTTELRPLVVRENAHSVIYSADNQRDRNL